MLRYLIAGESHGRGLLAIIEGMPAGLKLSEEAINRELKRRQSGFGRGLRMKIENDRAEILSGLRKHTTIGSPIALLVRNKDFKIEVLPAVDSPRPGHADLAGVLKYGFSDARDVLERASARSTAATVAVGAVCREFLSEFGIGLSSRVLSVGGAAGDRQIRARIKEAVDRKDTVGGVFEVAVKGVPAGLGSYVQPDRRLDARFAAAIMSIPGIKAVEVGLGFGYAGSLGSRVHDEIFYSRQKGFIRKSNNAGGIEGGISNGEEIVLRACMKPISTLMNPLNSVSLRTKKNSRAAVERSDTCVVQAAGVVAESACAFVVAESVIEKFGGDCLKDIKGSLAFYLRRAGIKK